MKTLTQQHSEALVETTDGAKGAAAVHAPVGGLVADCHIGLQPNDVVDSINFDRFFRISATLGQIAPDASGKIYDAGRVAAASHGVGDWTHVRGPRPSPAPQTGAFANIPGLRLALHMLFRQFCDGPSFADITRLVNSDGTFHIDRPDLGRIREARLDGLYALCLEVGNQHTTVVRIGAPTLRPIGH